MDSPGLVALAIFCIALGLLGVTLPKAISWALLIIALISFMIAIRQPRFLFKKRLNDYFVVTSYPFSKWKCIYQQPRKSLRSRKTGSVNCRQHYKALASSMASVFEFLDKEQGYYRTITHDMLKDRLLHMQDKGKIQILTCEPAYKRDLTHIQKYLFFNRCKKCSITDSCYFRNLSNQQRQFYYIEFLIS